MNLWSDYDWEDDDESLLDIVKGDDVIVEGYGVVTFIEWVDAENEIALVEWNGGFIEVYLDIVTEDN